MSSGQPDARSPGVSSPTGKEAVSGMSSRRDFAARFRSGIAAHAGIAALLLAFLLLGAAYSVVTPIFEAPDEIHHFFYVKHIADTGRLPQQSLPGQPGTPSGPARLEAWAQEGSQPPLYYTLAAALIAPLSTAGAESLLWENEHANLGDPLHLLNKNRIVHTDAETWPYRGSVLAIHLARWLSLLLGAATVLVTYLVAGLLLAPDEGGLPEPRPPLGLAAAALLAFTPQFIFMSSAVSNDVLIALLATLGAWISLRGLLRPFKGWPIVLGLILGLAALSKVSGLVLWLLVGIVLLAVGLHRGRIRETLVHLGIIFGIALLVAGWWYYRNWRLYGDVTGLGPMLDIVGRQAEPLGWRALLSQFQGLRISYWALFGWFNLPLPDWLYRVLDAFVVLALLGFAVAWSRGESLGLRDARWLLLPVGWIGLMLVSVARWTMLTPGAQGRLLFPAAWAVSFVLALGWSRWTGRRLGWQRTAWLAAPVAGLALLAVSVPFLVIRPAFQKPELITQAEVPAAARRAAVDHGGLLRSLGSSIAPATARPGDTVWATIYWEVLDRPNRDYTVFVHLLDHDGRSVAEANSWPGLGNYPTRLWQPGTVIVDRYPLRIPDDASAPVLLQADAGFFLWPQGDELPRSASEQSPGGQKTEDRRQKGPGAAGENGTPIQDVVGRLRLLPAVGAGASGPAVSLKASLVLPPSAAGKGNAIELLGYDLAPRRPVSPGDTVDVTLYWMAEAPPPADYTVFVHLLDPGDNKVAQGDGQPLDGAWPTSAWEPGQIVADRHRVTISGDVAPGSYSLLAGMYLLENGERLTVAGPNDRVRDDAIILGSLEVADE